MTSWSLVPQVRLLEELPFPVVYFNIVLCATCWPVSKSADDLAHSTAVESMKYNRLYSTPALLGKRLLEQVALKSP